MFFFKLAAVAAALAGHGHCAATNNVARTSSSTEVSHVRTYFYTGGNYVDDGAGGHIFRDQMYVEKLVPSSGATKKTPIVFIHGQAQTGSVRLLCPLTPL